MAESMKGLKRTHRCAELSAANVGEKVTIMGWVQKNRNKGGLVFVDVRDRSGIIQVVFEEGKCEAALIEKAAKLRAEYVVAIVGTVAKRSGAVNDQLFLTYDEDGNRRDNDHHNSRNHQCDRLRIYAVQHADTNLYRSHIVGTCNQ